MNFDPEGIQSIFETVGSSASSVGQIAKTVETLKGLFKGAHPATDADIKLALSDLTLQVANAQVANSELKFQLISLQKELAEMNAREADFNRYALWETPAGMTVYRLEEAHANGEPMHYLCPSCALDKTKSILQGHSEYRKCPRCKTGFKFDKASTPTTVRTRRGSRGVDWF